MIMILGTIVGIFGGAIQDSIEYFKERKQKEQDYKQQLELEKIRSENKIKEVNAGVLGQKEITKQSELDLEVQKQKTSGIKAEGEALVNIESEKTKQYWYSNLSKATNFLPSNNTISDIANLFIATARPMITYCLGFLMFWVVTHHDNFGNTPEWLQQFITMLGFQFEATISFWFYRNGSDKIQGLSKKK